MDGQGHVFDCGWVTTCYSTWKSTGCIMDGGAEVLKVVGQVAEWS
jgi:hypothetical protein